MNLYCVNLLRSLQHGPRTMKSMTHGDFVAAPTAIASWLKTLMDHGFVEDNGARPNRRYYITSAGEHWLANRPAIAQSRYLCNASMKSTYTPPSWTPARAGADSHRNLPSVGGC